MSVIRQLVEEKTGKPHVWRTEINTDSLRLYPADEEQRPETPQPYARIDFYRGHIVVQHLSGSGERLFLDTHRVLDHLKGNGAQPFVQVAEVERVGQ